MRNLMRLGGALAFVMSSLDAWVIETAPRISDCEIIASLARLDAGFSDGSC